MAAINGLDSFYGYSRIVRADDSLGIRCNAAVATIWFYQTIEPLPLIETFLRGYRLFVSILTIDQGRV